MDINEPIDLYAVFKNGKIRPIAFKWRKDKYIIDSLNLAYTAKEGIYRIFYYTVLAHNTLFTLSIHEKNHVCKLLQLETDA